MKPASKNILFGLLLVICLSTLLPVLGLSHFHTKGEPREAIVAVSMLQDGNWILPRNNGGDIALQAPHVSLANGTDIVGIQPGRGKRVHFAFPIGPGNDNHRLHHVPLLCQA